MFDETVPDSLFYISSVMNQHILHQVTEQANRTFKHLAKKDSMFFGKVSIVAHSLGTVISYDILVKQNPNNFKDQADPLEVVQRLRETKLDEVNFTSKTSPERPPAIKIIDSNYNSFKSAPGSVRKSKVFDEKGRYNEEYDQMIQLEFPVQNFFMLGSPVGMFCSVYSEEAFVRSQLPTCANFYNLFHPSDLVAYRIEPLIRNYVYGGEERKVETPVVSPSGSVRDGDNSNRRLVSHLMAGEKKTITQMYEEEKHEEIPPPVLIPCYRNRGLNKAQ